MDEILEEDVVSEGTLDSLQLVRDQLKSVIDIFPAEGEETEFMPDTLITDMGKLDTRETRRVFTLREAHLVSIATQQPNEKKGGEWFSTGRWEVFEDDALESHENLTVEDFEAIVKTFAGMNYLGVIRLTSYNGGDYEGETIIQEAFFTGWYWVANLKSKEIVYATYMDVRSDNYIFSMEEDDGDMLSDNLYGNVFNAKNEIINKLAGTSEEDYVGHYIE